MTLVWEAEHAITPEVAKALIAENFPNLMPVRLQWLGTGWDNTAFLVNERFVFRFPRRSVALPLLEMEWQLLPWLAPQISLPIPTPHFRGVGNANYPWPFLGFEFLPETTMCSHTIAESNRISWARPLARFLRELHSLPVNELQKRKVERDRFGKLDFKTRIPQAKANLEKLRQLGHLADLTPLLRIVDSVLPHKATAPPCLVHGDLYARHLLIDRDFKLCGVIDWGDAHLGDPITDLEVAFSILPPVARPTFRDEYGEISDTHWMGARFRGLSHSSVVAIYGDEANEPALLQAGLQALSYIARDEEL